MHVSPAAVLFLVPAAAAFSLCTARRTLRRRARIVGRQPRRPRPPARPRPGWHKAETPDTPQSISAPLYSDLGASSRPRLLTIQIAQDGKQTTPTDGKRCWATRPHQSVANSIFSHRELRWPSRAMTYEHSRRACRAWRKVDSNLLITSRTAYVIFLDMNDITDCSSGTP